MKPRHTLSKNERLKSYRSIRLLFAEGERFRQAPLMVHVLLSPMDQSPEKPLGAGLPLHQHQQPVLQMGVSVGARNFKKAVQRNLLKRRIREAYRKQKHSLEALLQTSPYRMDLFLVYADKTESDYATIYVAVEKAIEKLKLYLSNRPLPEQK